MRLGHVGIVSTTAELLPFHPRAATESEPVKTPFALAVAIQADVVATLVAHSTVVMEIVLDVFLLAPSASYIRLRVALDARNGRRV